MHPSLKALSTLNARPYQVHILFLACSSSFGKEGGGAVLRYASSECALAAPSLRTTVSWETANRSGHSACSVFYVGSHKYSRLLSPRKWAVSDGGPPLLVAYNQRIMHRLFSRYFASLTRTRTEAGRACNACSAAIVSTLSSSPIFFPSLQPVPRIFRTPHVHLDRSQWIPLL
jgi:hypothetical protein